MSIWLKYLIVVFLLVWGIPRYCFRVVQVIGVSMQPALLEGDVLFVDALCYRMREPERFDIIVFPYQGKKKKYYIKRVIALPGETIEIDETGYILIDGKRLLEYYGMEPIQDGGIVKIPLTLEQGQYFVLGDNRNDSSDSRFEEIGVVSKNQIVGKAVFRIFPINAFGTLEVQ